MNRTYVVILTPAGCTTVEMTEERNQEMKAMFDNDISVYVECAISEEIDCYPSDMQWMVVEEGCFQYFGHLPKFKKLK